MLFSTNFFPPVKELSFSIQPIYCLGVLSSYGFSLI